MKKIGVLICDDSALMRMTIKKLIESDRHLYVVGTARDGEDAIEKARTLKPDVITMDINMPGLDGLSALQIIVHEEIAPVIMVSSLTQEGAVTTFEALELGAFDYVGKPGGTVSSDMSTIARELLEKIKAAAAYDPKSKLVRKTHTQKRESKKTIRLKPRKAVRKPSKPSDIDFAAIAIGISTGGPKTIFEVLPYLPADLNAAIFLVQHMPPNFTSSFAERIDQNTALRCVEANAGMLVEPSNIYLGKGGHHLTLLKKSNGQIVIRTPTRPKSLFMPSADVMMKAVAGVFGSNTIGVIMTGMGKDGTEGMEKIVEMGGITIAESEESAIVFGMPREVIERGLAQIIAPSWKIADHLLYLVNGKLAAQLG